MAKKQFKAESKRLLDLMINSIYTHKEIFLREIISNASDAIDKMNFKSMTESTGMSKKDFKITVKVDKDARTVTVSDNGIGMTKDEMESNLGVIAHSGSLDFKTVNDTYGHLCGDSVLRKVAELVKQGCQDCIVCRWGGEEFIILSAKHKCSTDILETLRRRIASEEFSYDNVTFRITVTIGAAGYDSELTNDGWVSKADEKLYFGKTHGKNQVVL